MTVATVRTIIADPIQFDRSTAVGDASGVDFELPNSPVYPGSAKIYKDGVLQVLGTNYTIDEAIGVVSFTAAPGNGSSLAMTYKHSLLSDADIATFLVMYAQDDRLAAAMALETIATSESLIQKRIRILDTSTDGPGVAADLRAHAATLRKLVAEGVGNLGDPGFDIAEWGVSDFARREVIIDAALRGQSS